MRRETARIALIALTALAAGAVITAAIMTALVLTDFTSVVVMLGIVAGTVLLVATVTLVMNARVAGLISMLAGLMTILLGVVQIALLGLTWQAPQASITQPAWLEEFFNITIGAIIGGLGIALWRPRVPARYSSPTLPTA